MFSFTKKKIDLAASDFCYTITKKNEKRGKLLSYYLLYRVIIICVYYFTRITGVVLFLGDLTCPEHHTFLCGSLGIYIQMR